MGRPRWWPGNRRLVQVVDYRQPDALTRWAVGIVDVAHAQGMNGASGSILFGEPSSPAMKYSGDLGPLQDFRGGAFVTAAPASAIAPSSTALPATVGPHGRPLSPVMSVLAQTSPGNG